MAAGGDLAELPPAKSIVIARRGPTDTWITGEVGEFLNSRTGWNSNVDFTLVTSTGQILPGLSTAITAIAEQYLSKLVVTVLKKKRKSLLFRPWMLALTSGLSPVRQQPY
jgi:NADH dehydrogenase FAD-containing subunit